MIQYLSKNKVQMILDQLAFYKKAHKGDRAYQFWQEVDYIHNNPVKRGYVNKAEPWRYSSARDYLGQQQGLLEVCTQW